MTHRINVGPRPGPLHSASRNSRQTRIHRPPPRNMTTTPLSNLFLRAPDITHVAPPYCLNATWQAENALHTTKTDPACLAARSYLVRASCSTSGPIHCFFFAVYKDSQHSLPLVTELRNFADLVNHPPVLRELEDKRGGRLRCTGPFSCGTIKDVSGASPAGEYTINGIVYHCHCRYPFSKTCWLGASAALQHLRSISSSGTAARAAEQRRHKIKIKV
uniref:UL55 n=2 Tax=Human herpesvirus 2 TaxID=10310 RepID=A0A481THS2_HHV2|nr:UL55 [Human alphaherpesvirus 2]